MEKFLIALTEEELVDVKSALRAAGINDLAAQIEDLVTVNIKATGESEEESNVVCDKEAAGVLSTVAAQLTSEYISVSAKII